MSTDEAADCASVPNLEAALTLAWAKSSLDTTVGAALSRVGLSLDDLRRLRLIDARPQGLGREDLAEAMGETLSQAVRASLPLVKLGWLSRSESGAFSLTDSGRFLVSSPRASQRRRRAAGSPRTASTPVRCRRSRDRTLMSMRSGPSRAEFPS